MTTSAGSPFPSSSGDSMTGSSDIPGGATQADATQHTAAGSEAGAGAHRTALPEGDLLARVVQGAHDAVDRLAESAAPHVQRLQEGVTSANDTLHSRADQVRDVSDEWAESLRCTVRENPLASVAAALAIGLIVARLTS